MSTKDLSYLTDIFQWNYNALKTAQLFQNSIKDEQVKNLFTSIIELHTINCQKIITILGGNHD